MLVAQSMLIAVDGESRCGKSTLAQNIADEAVFQASIIPSILELGPDEALYYDDQFRTRLGATQEILAFNEIVPPISAGNVFRAAALYVALLGVNGEAKLGFDESDAVKVREILQIDGITDVLQNDPNVKKLATPVARMAGIQALGGTIFCDYVLEAYNRNGGGNLVIADARDPIGHLRRNNAIGHEPGQIDPASIVPIYAEAPPEVAASWPGRDFEAEHAHILERRFMDATREELPVFQPPELVDDLGEWYKLFPAAWADGKVVTPYRWHNGHGIEKGHIQNFAGRIAEVTMDMAFYLGQHRTRAPRSAIIGN